jgi:hypothetical protein
VAPKLLKAVPALPVQRWAPLLDAFLQIRNALRSHELAAHRLQGLRTGQLIGAAQRLLPDAAIAYFICAPEFWQTEVTLHWCPDIDWSDGTRQHADAWVTPVPGHERQGRWFFFVQRAELNRDYPIVAATVAVAPSEQPDGNGSPEQQLIKQLADEEWPDGYDHLKTRYIIDRLAPKFTNSGKPVPKRDVWLRALDRRKG